jgi:chaperonin GroES
MDGREITLGDRVVPVYSMPIKEGDKVFFSFYAGTEIEHEGKTYLIMRITDLISRL